MNRQIIQLALFLLIANTVTVSCQEQSMEHIAYLQQSIDHHIHCSSQHVLSTRLSWQPQFDTAKL